MQFVLIDDVASHNDILEAKLTRLCHMRGWDCHIALKTTSAGDVLAYAKECRQPTVYFLDIRLSDQEDTLTLFRTIQAQHHESYIVYISAFPQYAMNCMHTHAFDFLMKPLMDEQLADCMDALMNAHHQRHADTLLNIQFGNRLLVLHQEDILYFSREKMNIRAYCADGASYVWRESFEHLLPRLQSDLFALCHRGYIVGLRHILDAQWGEDAVILQSGQRLPISRRRAPALRAAIAAREERA